MGCDYYVYTHLYVTYDSGKTDYIELSQTRGYFSEYWGDSDAEDYESCMKADEEKQLLREDSTKVLMEDGKWLITRESRIDDYIKKIGAHQDNLWHVEKRQYAMTRC